MRLTQNAVGAPPRRVAAMAKAYRETFGATNFDLVHYVSYQDKLGIITSNATTP